MTVTTAGVGVGRTAVMVLWWFFMTARRAGAASLAVTSGALLCFGRRVLGILHG